MRAFAPHAVTDVIAVDPHDGWYLPVVCPRETALAGSELLFFDRCFPVRYPGGGTQFRHNLARDARQDVL